MFINIRQEESVDLMETKLGKFQMRTSEGLDIIIAWFGRYTTGEFVQQNAMRIKELEKVLKTYDMTDIFSIFVLNEVRENDPQILQEGNLLENYTMLTLE